MLSKSEKISRKFGISNFGVKHQIEEIFNSISKDMSHFDTKYGLFRGLLMGPILDFIIRDDINPEILARAKTLFKDTDDFALLETQYEEYVEKKFEAIPSSDLKEHGELLDSEKLYERYEKAARDVVDKIVADHTGENLNFALVKSAVNSVNMPDDKLTTQAIKQLQKGNFNARHVRNFQAYKKQANQNALNDFIFKFLGGKNPDPTDKTTALFIKRVYLMMKGLSSHGFESLKIFQTGDDEKLLVLSIDQKAWLRFNLKKTLCAMPEGIISQGAANQIVRTTFGVAINSLWDIPQDTSSEAIVERFFKAAQKGLLLGMAYAIVDGLLDIKNNPGQMYSEGQKKEVFQFIRNLLSGNSMDRNATPLGKMAFGKIALELYKHVDALPPEERRPVQTALLMLLEGQIRDDKLEQITGLTLRDILISMAIKGGATYLSGYLLGGQPYREENLREFMESGLLGQISDDFHDCRKDRDEGVATLFTLAGQCHINPIETYLSVISYLAERFKDNPYKMSALGEAVYRPVANRAETLNLLYDLYHLEENWNQDYFEYLCQISEKSMASGASRSHYSIFANVQRVCEKWHPRNRDLATFHMDVIDPVNEEVLLSNPDHNPLVDTANYSLNAGGKRLRPILVMVMASIYKIEPARAMPLAATIERLHTASLILDDLPAQDDANTRRGKPTAHKQYPEWNAQLAAIELIMSAIEVCANGLVLQGFDADIVNKVVYYIANKSRRLNQGQAHDLELSKNPNQTMNDAEYLQQLDEIAALKTGTAIDLSIVPVAMLAEADESTIQGLQDFSRRLGILYQVVDDILDCTSTPGQLGKDTGIDAKNGLKTSVDILGIDNAKARMNKMAKDIRQDYSALLRQSKTLRDIVEFIVTRKK